MSKHGTVALENGVYFLAGSTSEIAILRVIRRLVVVERYMSVSQLELAIDDGIQESHRLLPSNKGYFTSCDVQTVLFFGKSVHTYA